MHEAIIEAIRESLLNQLRAKGADVPHFTDLIDQYIFYAEQVHEMQDDIREKGMTYEAVSSVGKVYEKDNPCVKLLPNYTKAMQGILKDMGLTTDQPTSAEESEL